MKTNHLLLTLIVLLFTNLSGYAQDYIPILMDSQYTWSWSAGFDGDTVINESRVGLSYDADDRITQRRDAFGKLTYTYGTDTIFLFSELLDETGIWTIFSRGTEVYEAGKITSKLTERYIDNGFENSARHSYFYDNAQLDTLYLLEHWKEGEWVDFYKKTKTFDANGNNTEEGEYYANNLGDFQYSRGKLFDYNNANRLIQQIRVNGSNDGPYFSSRANWIYGNDDLLDSIQQCNYVGGVCKNVYLETRDYSNQDTILAKRFSWSDDEWQYYGKEFTFKGEEIYSSSPDSVIFHTYWTDSMSHTPTHRQYFQYQDLGNDSIYYKATTYHYFPAVNTWQLTRLTEEWYHPKSTTGIRQNADNTPNQLSIFPNPATAGQQVRLKQNTHTHSNQPVEMLVFDLQGQLITKTVLNGNASFQAPNQQGVYTILVRQNERVIGLVKQVVVE